MGKNIERPFSLHELNNSICKTLSRAFVDAVWLQAEMSDVRVNAVSGHCYLEFLEKNIYTEQVIAKARATIWANTFRMIKPYFEEETGQPFTSGLKVLVRVKVEFHELYGYSLLVLDIDPTYTIGEMARKRLEIIRQLREEGVFDLNKELTLPTLPQRIAIISSATAAGYEDFLNQLMHNAAGYQFYPKLFPSVMQGDGTEDSVIAALDNIYTHREWFDAVVIIRGGGSAAELSCFDTYQLAANCAQFPLPILTGIGHERDESILDLVAHTRLKTPTAVAEFLLEQMEYADTCLSNLQREITDQVTEKIHHHTFTLHHLASRLPRLASDRVVCSRSALVRLQYTLETVAKERLSVAIRELDVHQMFIRLSSPDYVLKRGYSMALTVGGKIVKRASGILPGEELITRFSDGEVRSIVKK